MTNRMTFDIKQLFFDQAKSAHVIVINNENLVEAAGFEPTTPTPLVGEIGIFTSLL